MVQTPTQAADPTTAEERPAFTLKGRLRAAREDARMRQVDVAEAMGRPQSFVSNLETGERRPRFDEVVQLARLYKREIVYFAVGVA